MEKRLTSSSFPADCDGRFRFFMSPADDEGIYECTVLEADTPVSSFMVLPYKKTPTAYFFDWKVYVPGLGTGSRLFPAILSYLSQNYSNIKLQVSSDNTAAMKIYKANGLVITETCIT